MNPKKYIRKVNTGEISYKNKEVGRWRPNADTLFMDTESEKYRHFNNCFCVAYYLRLRADEILAIDAARSTSLGGYFKESVYLRKRSMILADLCILFKSFADGSKLPTIRWDFFPVDYADEFIFRDKFVMSFHFLVEKEPSLYLQFKQFLEVDFGIYVNDHLGFFALEDDQDFNRLFGEARDAFLNEQTQD